MDLLSGLFCFDLLFKVRSCSLFNRSMFSVGLDVGLVSLDLPFFPRQISVFLCCSLSFFYPQVLAATHVHFPTHEFPQAG